MGKREEVIPRMNKLFGGMLLIGLATILFMSYYNFVTNNGKSKLPPHKQSAADFFNNHPSQDMETKVLQNTGKKKNEKPHLIIDVEGLNDLYELRNISEQGESKPLLVWVHMKEILSRSDPLPHTLHSIKEAAIAFNELLSTMEEEKLSSDGENPSLNDCPYLVSAHDRTKYMSRDNVVIQIPCGLMEDSSITVIGIPNEHYGSFHIELVGSQLPNGTSPLVILHYDVQLPGDNVTKEPVIVQSTWTNELGWGKEERCPDHGSSSATKVDGLWKCNEKVVLNTDHGENLNASRNSDGERLTYNSSSRAHVSATSPFLEGNPFTATLWVGLEGFHMTVNGRHETSFAYREKLEPWLVNGVKVGGNLNLISALAKGLPVSEEIDMVDINHLKAPPLASSKRLVLLIAVFSTANNFERRLALRKSWMQYEAIRSGVVAVRFFIGLHKNKEVNFQVWKEAQAYGDIQLMPFVDYYSLLTIKTIAMCILGTKLLPVKYIMKTDDDAFVRVDEVLSSLKGKVSDGLLYGRISFESSPHRNIDNKWYISAEEWPRESYPPWAHGPGYIISRDIAKFIVQGHQKRSLQLFKLEDVAVGIWIEQFKNQGRKVEYVSDDRFYNAGCEANYILAHYQNPRKVLCLWEKLQREHKPECCE